MMASSNEKTLVMVAGLNSNVKMGNHLDEGVILNVYEREIVSHLDE